MTEAVHVPPGAEAFANARRFAPNGRGAKSRFRLIPFSEIELQTAPAYLIKGLLPRTGLIVVWGPPKCGKSFVVFDMTMHIALGWDYRGLRTNGGTVVYCALEGAEGFRARISAFRQRHFEQGNAGDIPFNLIASPLTLAADAAALVESIRAALGPNSPAVVVVDTLNRSLAGSESDDKDMGAYIRAADAIRDAFGCAVIVVHHSGIEGSRPRGHTSLTGAADAQLSVKRDGASNIVVAVEWMKDGPEGQQFVSRLEAIEVGRDDDGDAITSCVVEPIDGPAGRTRQPGPKLTKGARIALAALIEAVGEVGEIPPASNHMPSRTPCVTISQWRNYAYRRGISTSEDARAKQLAFQRATEVLVAANQVGIWDPYAWALGGGEQ